MVSPPSRAGSSGGGQSTPAAAARAQAPSPVTIDELVLADEPERWAALGFTLAGDVVQLGAVRVRLAGCAAGRGIVGWSLRGLAHGELDGLDTTPSHSAQPDAPPEHRNGIVGIDHVVAMTPDLDRSVRALRRAGLDLRRIREQPTPAGAPRQAFFRLGAEILEVVQEPERVVAERGGADRPIRLWGLALTAPDLDRTVGALSPHAGAVRDAVQPGRRIATLKRSGGLAVPVALMSPRSEHPERAAPTSPPAR
jgi:catechol 2,3-dioxygenase-like lactoylglutathione lyase family enzyme